MKILSLDTSNINCDISVLDNEVLVSRKVASSAQSHSSNLIPLIKEELDSLNLKIKDIDLIVANVGPGSFTGIRVGISTALSFIDSFNINSVGVNTLELLACSKKLNNTVICSILKSNNDSYYYAVYLTDELGYIKKELKEASCDDFNCIVECLTSLEKEHSNKIVLVSDLILSDTFTFTSLIVEPSSYDLGLLGLWKVQNNISSTLTPLYIKKPQAQIQLEEKLLKGNN